MKTITVYDTTAEIINRLAEENDTSAAGEYFCENCEGHAEIYSYECKNCCTGDPKTCGVSNWGAPWKRRTYPADKWDNYQLGEDRDAPIITGEYTEKIMTDWGIPYPKD